MQNPGECNGMVGDSEAQIPPVNKSGCHMSDKPVVQYGESSILKSQVKSMIVNVVLIVKQDCDLKDFPRDFHNHTNVEVQSENVVVHTEKSIEGGSLDLYQSSLRKKLEDIRLLSDRRIFSILKDLAGGVKRLHDMKKPHGKIIPDNVFLSTDERNHPFLRGSETNNNNCNPQDDIKDLGKLFYYVLTNGTEYNSSEPVCVDNLKCDEKHTVLDLLSKMIGSSSSNKLISLSDVLEHPMFLSEKEKLHFITDVYDSVSHNRTALKELEPKALGMVFEGEWKKALVMTPFEKDKLGGSGDVDIQMDYMFRLAGGAKKKKTNLSWTIYFCDGQKVKRVNKITDSEWKKLTKKLAKQNENGQAIPSKDAIEKLISEHGDLKGKECEIFSPIILVKTKEDGGYDKNSIYDLLRFIRNKKAHLLEADILEENCYEAAGGFWKFFISRYPTLLVFIYNNLDSFEHYHPSN